jgi:hypothetical protein
MWTNVAAIRCIMDVLIPFIQDEMTMALMEENQ